MSVGDPWLRWRLEDERKHTYAAPWRKDCACETCRAAHPEHWITFAALDPACVLPSADEPAPIYNDLINEPRYAGGQLWMQG